MKMSEFDIDNTSVETLNFSQGINNTNMSEIPLIEMRGDFIFRNTQIFVMMLFVISILLSVGTLIAIGTFLPIVKMKRRESWFCIITLFFIAIFILYFHLLPKLLFEIYANSVRKNTGMCLFAKSFLKVYAMCEYTSIRTFVLTFANWMHVAFALNCYNIVFRNLLASPVPYTKLFTISAVFYGGVFLITVIISLLGKFLDTHPKVYCSPYFFDMWLYQLYPRNILVCFMFLVYFIPFFLVFTLYSVVILYLWNQPSFLKPTQPPLFLFKMDIRFLKTSLVMFLVYLFTNTPFIIEGAIVIFSNFEDHNHNLAIVLEILSMANISLNPYIYLLFEFGSEITTTIFKVLRFFARMLTSVWQCVYKATCAHCGAEEGYACSFTTIERTSRRVTEATPEAAV